MTTQFEPGIVELSGTPQTPQPLFTREDETMSRRILNLRSRLPKVLLLAALGLLGSAVIAQATTKTRPGSHRISRTSRVNSALGRANSTATRSSRSIRAPHIRRNAFACETISTAAPSPIGSTD
jgi:hypothetical protein